MKVGDYVEVRVPQNASYGEVVEAAAQAVGLNDPQSTSSEEELAAESQGELSIFRSEGTRIPNSPLDLSTPWTVHEYMSSFPSYQRTGTAVKLGVGYTDPVSSTFLPD
jgi:hypothetical protein